MLNPLAPFVGEPLSDLEAMTLAIHEAAKGWGFVSPNPAVGCVILDSQNRYLSRGYHQRYGGPHAEIEALAKIIGSTADDLWGGNITDLGFIKKIKGARVLVTLEPCAHQGRTPSCAKTLSQWPLKEVIYGLVDPNPKVSGQGAQILQDAGIKATLFGQLKPDLEQVCEHFLENFRNQKPFVSLKVASSLDGQMALKTGESKWITGEKARSYGRFLRGCHDATLVGVNTILLDDPQLNLRHKKFTDKQNRIVILDPQGQVFANPDLQIFRIHPPENIIVVLDSLSAIPKFASGRATVVAVKSMKTADSEDLSKTFDLNDLLTKLWALEIRSVLVEGGAQTLSSFIDHNKAHRLYLFQAPIVLGAKTGKPWSEQVKIQKMSQKYELKNPKVKRLGSDLLITGLLTR